MKDRQSECDMDIAGNHIGSNEDNTVIVSNISPEYAPIPNDLAPPSCGTVLHELSLGSDIKLPLQHSPGSSLVMAECSQYDDLFLFPLLLSAKAVDYKTYVFGQETVLHRSRQRRGKDDAFASMETAGSEIPVTVKVTEDREERLNICQPDIAGSCRIEVDTNRFKDEHEIVFDFQDDNYKIIRGIWWSTPYEDIQRAYISKIGKAKYTLPEGILHVAFVISDHWILSFKITAEIWKVIKELFLLIKCMDQLDHIKNL